MLALSFSGENQHSRRRRGQQSASLRAAARSGAQMPMCGVAMWLGPGSLVTAGGIQEETSPRGARY